MFNVNNLKFTRKTLAWIEGAAVAIVFVLLAVFLARDAGGPVMSDEVMYINNGLMNVKDTFILNRYTHIYFQKLFMALASDPFSGVKAYWGFLVAGSAAMVYVIARLATRSSSIIHAGLSVLLYLSIPLLASYSGNTAVDITAGFFLALTALLFLLYLRHPSKVLLVLLGLSFFLAFRSKETTLAGAVLFAGFLFGEGGRIDWRLFLRRMLYVLIGALAGILLFAVLNGIFLKDAWFGLRPSDYFSFTKSYVEGNIEEESKNLVNWFTDYLFESILYIFVAYLLSGARRLGSLSRQERIPWLVPLAFVAILSAIIGFSKWGVVPRHIFPVLPLIAAFAPQLILHDKLEKKKDLLWLGISLLLTGAALLVGRFLLMKASLASPYNYPEYLSSSIYPIALLGLIALVFLVSRYSFKTLFLPLLIFGIFIRYPLTLNANTYFTLQPNVNKINERLQVFRPFEKEITAADPGKILVFEKALYRLNHSSRYAEFIGLYNMYFDKRLTTRDVTMTTTADFNTAMVSDAQPDVILVSAEEFDTKGFHEDFLQLTDGTYKKTVSKNGMLYLFTRSK